jgi:adenylate cyclase
MGEQVTGSTALCPTCGTDLRTQARFCDGCGSSVVANRSVGEHKQVTVLFTDVVGSMKLAATLDPERLRPGLDLWRLKCRAMVTRAEGNDAAYAELARQYLELAERLDARGCVDNARRMVAEII